MPEAAARNKRFAGKRLLWHLAGMKNRALLLSFCFGLLACSPKPTTATEDPLVEDDAASTDGDATGDGSTGTDVATCMSAGCPCTANSDCNSKLCATKGGVQVCVSCIATNGGVEKCDGLDNNCNGLTDESTCPGDGHCLLGFCDGTTNKCHMEPAPDQSSCDDGNACTIADKCATGACAGTLASCDDGNPCTSEDCAPAVGCQFLAVDATCTDNDACTIADACAGTTCAGIGKDCTDGNPCTTDSCGGGVCLSQANTDACDDGDGCTSGDVCANQVCAGIAGCQDGDPCTLDACDAGKKTCTHAPKTGWQAPLCTGCAPGFTGADCSTCTDASKTWPDC